MNRRVCYSRVHCIGLFLVECIILVYYFISLYNSTFIAECIALVYLLQNAMHWFIYRTMNCIILYIAICM
jgi:hypothetical protein